MLPPWLRTVSVPPELLPTIALSMLTFPVPPATVLASIVAADAEGFVVVIVPAVCDRPSDPAPSWFARRARVPPVPTDAAKVSALELVMETGPVVELMMAGDSLPAVVNAPALVPREYVKVVAVGTDNTTNVPLYAAGATPPMVTVCPAARLCAADVVAETMPPAVPPLV
jgi:hypothetical protein